VARQGPAGSVASANIPADAHWLFQSGGPPSHQIKAQATSSRYVVPFQAPEGEMIELLVVAV